jgi:hypothetical protein
MSPRPSDFSAVLQSVSPPLASPHTWERIIRIGPATGGSVQLTANVGARDAGVWALTFPLYTVHLDWLFDAMQREHVFDRAWRTSRDVPVGGGAHRLTLNAAGRRFDVPSHVVDDQAAFAAAAIAAVEALVPPQLLSDLERRREAYVKKHRSRAV